MSQGEENTDKGKTAKVPVQAAQPEDDEFILIEDGKSIPLGREGGTPAPAELQAKNQIADSATLGKADKPTKAGRGRLANAWREARSETQAEKDNSLETVVSRKPDDPDNSTEPEDEFDDLGAPTGWIQRIVIVCVIVLAIVLAVFLINYWFFNGSFL